jgi:hypothetical protein
VAEEMYTQVNNVEDTITQQIRVNMSGAQLRQAIHDYVVKHNPKVPTTAEINDLSVGNNPNSVNYIYFNNSIKIDIEKDEYGVIKRAKRKR